MRLGLISDVHANLHALEATIAALRRRGVDSWVSAGDLIGYGPRPNECVELVAQLDTAGVAGNHDLIALGRLAGGRSSDRARVSHRRTRDVLRDDVRSYLAALPLRVDLGPVVVTHGSLDDPETHVSTAARAAAELAVLRRVNPAARILVLGNTHRQMLVDEAARSRPVRAGVPVGLATGLRYVLNPGSVGQSRRWEWPPRARAAVLDLQEDTLLFEEIAYDVRACREELTGAGLPYRSVHALPPARSILTGQVRRLVARSRGRAHPHRQRPEAAGVDTDRGDVSGAPG